MYLAGSICFFVPVSKSRMIEYSRWYNRTNKQQCCGINNYKDYNDPGIFGTKEIRARVVYAELNADDAAWTANQEELIEELSRTKKDEDPKLRKHLYFNVPNTCCKYGRRIKYKHCGRFVEYSRVEYTKPNVTKSHPNAVRIVNNVTGGCFEKYETVMSNSMFQLNWLIGIVRWGSLAQCVIFFILIWIYRLSLRAMRRDMRGDFEEERLFHDEGENPQQRSKATLQNKDNLLETEIKGVSSNMTLKSE
ncbi:hypothetical protein Fcan01_04999 [Folsomia candida]|uniref:Uncharacterized protein n=1 Tax=Folsomia candida TaxID=158441 RepID=A0A226ETP7_FOLCA|nr:hypothetical protein Fcan01_04999 [Folsomia candida]